MVKLIDIRILWIKIIRVELGERTSLQYHARRSELHLSTEGIRYVPRKVLHRLYFGIYLELAWGCVSEHDIVRVQDDYDRI